MRKQFIERESPELQGLLEEFETALLTITQQIQPLQAKRDQFSKAMCSFIDLKNNLLLSYCTFLSFYLLLRVDSNKSQSDVRAHAVLFKITTLKQTLDGLSHMDEKLDSILLAKKIKHKLINEDTESADIQEEIEMEEEDI